MRQRNQTLSSPETRCMISIKRLWVQVSIWVVWFQTHKMEASVNGLAHTTNVNLSKPTLTVNTCQGNLTYTNYNTPNQSWTIKKAECGRIGFQTVALEKTLESPLECKEIKPVSPKGNYFWIFIGRTDTEAEAPILWPRDAKNWLIGKDPDARKDWRKKKGVEEDEMVGWHHQLNGHEFEQTPKR